jgi:hypothetical protein
MTVRRRRIATVKRHHHVVRLHIDQNVLGLGRGPIRIKRNDCGANRQALIGFASRLGVEIDYE